MSHPGQPPNDPYRDQYGSWSGDPYAQSGIPPAAGPPPPYGAPGPAHQPWGQAPMNPYAQSPYGFVPVGADPYAPYGRDPMSGLPYSAKSKVVAGLLQIFFGTFGIGRFYIGDNQTGGIQLGLTLVGFVTLFFLVGMFLILAVSLWALIDGILMLTGSVTDTHGYPLRP
ncbi:TM2 domain-containing protein [Gordonia mangrovi]|nr:TM2 domain-containing protein [Gordonia mangrovi]UVF78852.1 NINE protein [Gordonia mangrovi]